uniref:Uncharacterized protein n=1 Tax=Cacopsylla melanoneura TaxID=428564 RepID=A0A8D8Y733_9HEMI
MKKKKNCFYTGTLCSSQDSQDRIFCSYNMAVRSVSCDLYYYLLYLHTIKIKKIKSQSKYLLFPGLILVCFFGGCKMIVLMHLALIGQVRDVHVIFMSTVMANVYIKA